MLLIIDASSSTPYRLIQAAANKRLGPRCTMTSAELERMKIATSTRRRLLPARACRRRAEYRDVALNCTRPWGSFRRAHLGQGASIVARKLFQLIQIRDEDSSVDRSDQPPPPQLLHHPVRVNNGKAHCVGQILLLQGQGESLPISEPHQLKPSAYF